MPRFIGRAAQPIRPGFTIKDVLSAKMPLVTGEITREAAITDIHSVYKDAVRNENSMRPRDRQIRGCTYASFVKLFKFAQLLFLVELVREEPMNFPPRRGALYTVKVRPTATGRQFSAVISTRRIFRLSDVGAEDEKSWSNLCRAWIDGWPAPQKLEIPPPTVEVPIRKPREKPAAPPLAEAPMLKFELGNKPTPEKIVGLLAYLERLMAIGIDNPDVASETHRISMRLGDWILEAEDMLEDAKAVSYEEAVAQWQNMINILNSVSENLDNRNIGAAIEQLRLIQT